MTDNYLTDALAQVESFFREGDRLSNLRQSLKFYRDLLTQKQDLEQRLETINQQIRHLCDVELVQLFSTAQLSSLVLEAEGNLPALEAKRLPFYSAKLPEEEAARQKAFDWLEENGHSDIIKSLITVALGRGERSLAKKITDTLLQLGVSYQQSVSVHASTLKAFIKHEIEAGHYVPYDLLGAYAGETVKVTPVKE